MGALTGTKSPMTKVSDSERGACAPTPPRSASGDEWKRLLVLLPRCEQIGSSDMQQLTFLNRLYTLYNTGNIKEELHFICEIVKFMILSVGLS